MASVVQILSLFLYTKTIICTLYGLSPGAMKARSKEHSGNIQRTLREHSGHIKGTFSGQGNIRGTVREQSGNSQCERTPVRGTVREHWRTCKLTDGAIAVAADEFLDGRHTQDCFRIGANLHATARVHKHVHPSIPRQVFSDNHALASILVVNLRSSTGIMVNFTGG